MINTPMTSIYNLLLRGLCTVVLMLPIQSKAQSFQLPEKVDLGQIPVGLVVFHPVSAENRTDKQIALMSDGGFSFTSDAYFLLLPDSGCPGQTVLDPFETRDLMTVASTEEAGAVEAYAVISDGPESDEEEVNGKSIRLIAEGVIAGHGPLAESPEYALLPQQITGRVFINGGDIFMPSHLRYTNVTEGDVRIERAQFWNRTFAHLIGATSSGRAVELPYTVSTGATIDFEIAFTPDATTDQTGWDEFLVETSSAQTDLARFDIKPREALGTANIDRDEQTQAVDVYPNPAHSTVSVHGIDGGVAITDLLGRVRATSNVNSVDISRLPSGRYMISASHGSGRSAPLLIEH
jgi:hypothetical protein